MITYDRYHRVVSVEISYDTNVTTFAAEVADLIKEEEDDVKVRIILKARWLTIDTTVIGLIFDLYHLPQVREVRTVKDPDRTIWIGRHEKTFVKICIRHLSQHEQGMFFALVLERNIAVRSLCVMDSGFYAQEFMSSFFTKLNLRDLRLANVDLTGVGRALIGHHCLLKFSLENDLGHEPIGELLMALAQECTGLMTLRLPLFTDMTGTERTIARIIRSRPWFRELRFGVIEDPFDHVLPAIQSSDSLKKVHLQVNFPLNKEEIIPFIRGHRTLEELSFSQYPLNVQVREVLVRNRSREARSLVLLMWQRVLNKEMVRSLMPFLFS